MKPVRFHEDARTEALAAARYYDRQMEGLGSRFADAVELALHQMVRQPRMYPVLEKTVRKCRVQRFPYGVVYQVRPQCIYVVAVMHLHREPGYWKERLR